MRYFPSLRMRFAALLLLAGGALSAHAGPLGFYVGAGLSQANVKLDALPSGGALGFAESHTGWKVMAGIRPISLIGAEVEYFDSGTPSALTGVWSVGARTRGGAAFGLAYLPLPVPLLDVYGKFGVSRLQTSADAGLQAGIPCGIGIPCTVSVDQTDTRFAWGVGAQIKLALLGIRAEYERMSSPLGDPDFVSLSLLLRF